MEKLLEAQASPPSDEPDWDEGVIAYMENRTKCAIRVHRCRFPDKHPPFRKVGRLVRYVPAEYRKWKAEQLAAEQAKIEAKAQAKAEMQELAEQVAAAKHDQADPAKMRRAVKRLEDAILNLKQQLADEHAEAAE